MLLAHFAASGSAALDLPSWALAYGVFAVSVITILISRSRFVPGARPAATHPRTAHADAVETGIDDPDAHDVDARPGIFLTIGRVVTATLFWVLAAFCWFGPSSIAQNIAPLAIIGVLWSLGGWVALVFGWTWGRLDPFMVFTRRPPTSTPSVSPSPLWAPIPVFATFTVIWVVWVEGDEPRHLGVWLVAYGIAMIIVARRGGSLALRHWNAIPAALDLSAAMFRPSGALRHAAAGDERARTALLAAMVLAALGTNRIEATPWFTTGPGRHGEVVTAVVCGALATVLTGALLGIWRVCDRQVERVRSEARTYPLAAALGPIAGGVLLAQTLVVGLIQGQNLLVLVSDPFARGWDLFGTVYWQVSPTPLSPFAEAMVEVAVILTGHVAALVMIGLAATAPSSDGSTSPRARHRNWTAALPAMALATVSGVVWTFALV